MKNCWGQNQEKESKTHEIFIAPGPRLGDLVIETQNVSKAFGNKLLVDGMCLLRCRRVVLSVSSAPTEQAKARFLK